MLEAWLPAHQDTALLATFVTRRALPLGARPGPAWHYQMIEDLQDLRSALHAIFSVSF